MNAATILIVDDEESVVQLLQRVLVTEGYTVLAATTPNAAVDICRQTRRVDLLITDVTMPGMSGYDLAQAIFKLQPSTKVLFVSGYPQTIAGDEPRMSFLAKPFLPRQLVATVQILLADPSPDLT